MESARNVTKLATFIAWGALIMASATKAQDTTANDTSATDDPVIAALEKEKKKAELEKDIAVAEKAKLEAQLPSKTTGKEGTITLGDKAGYYAELMSYGTLGKAASKIGLTVKPAGDVSEIVLTNQMELSQKAQYWRLIRGRLQDFERRFGALIEKTDPEEVQKPADLVATQEALASALAAAPAILGGIADIAAFFKTDVELKGRDVTLAKSALLAEVAAALETAGWKSIYIPEIQTGHTGALVSLVDGIAGKRAIAVDQRRKLETLVEPTIGALKQKRAERTAKAAELKKLEKAKPLDQTAIDQMKKAIEDLDTEILQSAQIEDKWKKLDAEFEALFSTWDAYQKVITEGQGDKPSPIESLAVVDLLQAKGDADRLHVEVASSGGEVHLSKSVWASRISYLGGSVISYFWVDKDGGYKGSGTVRLWEGRSVNAKEMDELGSDTGADAGPS